MPKLFTAADRKYQAECCEKCVRDEILAIRLNIGHTDTIWTDDDLLAIYAAKKTIHGVIAACMEQLAMDPSKARRWEQGVKFTHYDYMQMAKYHNELAKRSDDG